jgi:environmental stress-induced protein Ves
MANTATVVIISAGGMTFANEWYQTNKINWRIPVATVILAGLFDVFGNIDAKAANITSVIVLIGALTTRFNGNSVADELAGLYPGTATKTTGKKK